MNKKILKSLLLNPKSSHGFTLIELLVVVAIIGILSALLMSNFIGVRQRARDAQRKSDLRQIQTALELYRADVGSYPVASSTYFLSNTLCPTPAALTNGGTTTYMSAIACDPSGITGWNFGNYEYRSTSGATYQLYACLENSNDQDPHDITAGPGRAPNSNICPASTWFKVTNP